MIFRDFPERLLASKVKLKLVLSLLERSIPVSERQLARILGLSHVAVNKAMKDFESLNLINSVKIGNALVWALNRDSYAYECLQDFKRLAIPALDELKNNLFREFNTFSSIQKLFLYGSIVDGSETSGSDIDILIVCTKNLAREAILDHVVKLSKKFATRYGNSLHAEILTSAEVRGKKQRIFENALKHSWVVISR